MNKSFGYWTDPGQFRIARHQVGDFGLHLSLIRSFSWGDNFPVESPFFPGQSLPYHYYFDLVVGFLEKLGLRIDFAFNGLSVIALTVLLFLIYRLSQIIFGKNQLLGILSVGLFLLPSRLSFIDFLKMKPSLYQFWFLPDYLHKGPFDGSLISIFFTLNVFLNQRHFIAGLAISLAIFSLLISRLMKKQPLKPRMLVCLGLLLGLSSRIHSLSFLSTSLVLFFLFFFFKQQQKLPLLFLPALVVFLPHGLQILGQDLNHRFWRPGFLTEHLADWLKFWFLNLGLATITIPIGVVLAGKKQKKVFFSFLALFIIGNLFQLSFRIDHNHSLFNFFFLIANFYSASFLIWLWKRKRWQKGLAVMFLFCLTFSGLIDLMAIKNDFQLMVDDAPANQLMEWIKKNTDKKAIFLGPVEILDPITLSGRYNYLGHDYYLEVMGYNFTERKKLVKRFLENYSAESIIAIKKEGINYLLMPSSGKVDFFQENLKLVYQKHDWLVFQL